MAKYHCSIESCQFSTDSPLGMTAHSRSHRNRFEELAGRPPEDYEEVRQLLNGGHDGLDISGQASLGRFG